MKSKILLLILIILLLPINNLEAAELENYFLQGSLYTCHYDSKDYHNNNQQLIGLERHYSDQRLDGIAYFKNSYDQSTFYIYKGKKTNFFSLKNLVFTGKVTYGIVHGYDDENGRYTAWMNQVGTFPALVLGFGVKWKNLKLDVIPFADAGLIVTTGIEF